MSCCVNVTALRCVANDFGACVLKDFMLVCTLDGYIVCYHIYSMTEKSKMKENKMSGEEKKLTNATTILLSHRRERERKMLWSGQWFISVKASIILQN